MYELIVYTCITNDYDVLIPAQHKPEDVRFICFTDRSELEVNGWETRPLASPQSVTKPDLINRYHKFFPNRVLPEVDCSIYIDGNIQVIGNVRDLAKEYCEEDVSLVRIKHPIRDNVYQEAKKCKARSLFSETQLKRLAAQLDFYAREGMPEGEPLSDNGVLIRYHGNPEWIKVMDLWWNQINLFTVRDQLSLPYCIWKCKLKAVLITEWSLRGENPYFKVRRHREPGLKGRLQAFSLQNERFGWLYSGLTRLTRIKARAMRRKNQILQRISRS